MMTDTPIDTPHPCHGSQIGGSAYHDQMRAASRAILAHALAAAAGNRTHAAHALGLQRTYLLRLMREHGLQDRTRPGSPSGRRGEGSGLRGGGTA